MGGQLGRIPSIPGSPVATHDTYAECTNTHCDFAAPPLGCGDPGNGRCSHRL